MTKKKQISEEINLIQKVCSATLLINTILQSFDNENIFSTICIVTMQYITTLCIRNMITD